MITFREPWPDEWERAVRICQNGINFDQCVVAVDDAPVERLVGAVFWKLSGPGLATFDWRVLPALMGSDLERELLAKLKEEVVTRTRAVKLKRAGQLAAGAPAIDVLEAAGFQRFATNIYMETTQADLARNNKRMERVFASADVSGIEIRAPEKRDVPMLKALVADEGALLPATAIEEAFSDRPVGELSFHPEWSTVLVERVSGRLLGAQLVKVWDDMMTIPAFATDPSAPLLPGLGWFLLFQGWNECCASRGWSGRVCFRINPDASPAMVKISNRFGFREFRRHYSYASELRRPETVPSLEP